MVNIANSDYFYYHDEIVNVLYLQTDTPLFLEAVTRNHDGSYTIMINNALCEEKQKEKLNHALKHISSGDFDKTDIQEIEGEAHNEKS